MARRRIAEEPMSLVALWARRAALFALVASLLSIAIIWSELLEIKPTMVTLVGALAFAVVAILLAFVAFIIIWRQGIDGFGSAVLALVIGSALLLYPAYLALQAYRLPAITDVVTDPDDPPRFETAGQLRTREANPVAYPGKISADKQRMAYPDIEPLIVTSTPQEAYDTALTIINRRRWKIIVDRKPIRREGRTAARDGHIEAVARNPLALREDVVLRVRADGEGARIDIRSATRYGPHDLGSNASRITALLDEIDETLGTQAEKKAAPKRPQPAKPTPAKR
jgi:uncharacterized protein (DUF1499 family)